MKNLKMKVNSLIKPTREAQLKKLEKRAISNVIEYLKYCEKKCRPEAFFDSAIVTFERSDKKLDVNKKERAMIMNKLQEKLTSMGYKLRVVKSIDESTYEILVILDSKRWQI